MVVINVPCLEMGCFRCCMPKSVKAGGMTGDAEMHPRLRDVEYNILADGRRVIEHVRMFIGGKSLCSQLTADGCRVYADRPAVCRYYPFMLYRNELTVSLTCPWVIQELLPRLSRHISEGDRAMFVGLRKEMLAVVPLDVRKHWDEDQDDNVVVIQLKGA